MSCCPCDECATEKTEAKEFAYFSGLTTGVQHERRRIIKLLEGFDPRTAIGDLLPLLIKGENK